MIEEEELSGSGSGSESVLSSSPGSKSNVASGGSALFKTVLEDIVLDTKTRISKSEFERYKSRQQNKDKNCVDHTVSRRCESCQAVTAFCKCDLYNGHERKFGHRVHWADEVWNKPLMTVFCDDDNTDSDNDTHEGSHSDPKPILKHRATCIVIVSE